MVHVSSGDVDDNVYDDVYSMRFLVLPYDIILWNAHHSFSEDISGPYEVIFICTPQLCR